MHEGNAPFQPSAEASPFAAPLPQAVFIIYFFNILHACENASLNSKTGTSMSKTRPKELCRAMKSRKKSGINAQKAF